MKLRIDCRTCHVTGKHIYLSKRDAERAILLIRIKYYASSTPREQFYYKCPHCTFFHLTKKPQPRQPQL